MSSSPQLSHFKATKPEVEEVSVKLVTIGCGELIVCIALGVGGGPHRSSTSVYVGLHGVGPCR